MQFRDLCEILGVPQLPGRGEGLEAHGVREGAGREGGVGDLEQAQQGRRAHQNRKYRWASGSRAAGSEVRISPSARTS